MWVSQIRSYQKLNLNRFEIHRFLKRIGIQIRQGSKPIFLSDKNTHNLINDYQKGISLRRLYKKYNLSYYPITKIIKKNGIYRRNPVIKIGQTFRRLTVLEHIEHTKDTYKYKCLCECGNMITLFAYQLIHGNNKSCGCLEFKRVADGNSCENRLIRNYRNDAEKRNLKWDLTKEEAHNYFIDRCFYCDTPPFRIKRDGNAPFIFNGIDRVNNTIGYNKNNCVTACFTCNRAKGEMSLQEFKSWINKIFKNQEQSK